MQLAQILHRTERYGSATYRVTLTAEERARLVARNRTGNVAARTLTHAWILVKADAKPHGPGWTDERIQDAVDVGIATSARVRRAVVDGGGDAALNRKNSP